MAENSSLPLHFSVARNAWESEFFGMEIGKLQFLSTSPTALIAEAEQSAVFADFDLLQCKLSADQIEQIGTLQQLGFRFIEGELDFCLLLSATMQTLQPLDVAGEADIAELERIFGDAFGVSRFRQPWFSVEQNKAFYRTWIRKAVLGQFDHVCLVSRDINGGIRGAVSLRKLDADNARIGLLAVTKQARGQGVAGQLLQSAVNWSLQQRHKQLWIATQSGNSAAINLYQKQGRIAQISYWFYR
ncbi:dTDP-4-amino-4,6-dideoxy-D-galactose acyltransferase [Chelonobacter oris]|uniref:dTDP-4-amino-4,6-dideoxy-D-galactose acyltransferase n=1 Tax=Chelonobacter oris TaxID=505317 RepID=UPI0024488CD6|nr:dTDP-4-amino-4,6-dideoxy-D-galactose acyltransferase [Chelonobacter oris]